MASTLAYCPSVDTPRCLRGKDSSVNGPCSRTSSSETFHRDPESCSPFIDPTKRHDICHWRVFTIDGATTRDIDDALSIHRNMDGTWEIGVHIADVSWFVRTSGNGCGDGYQRYYPNSLSVPSSSSPSLAGLEIDDDRVESEVDIIASARSTSVYLVQRAIPMLPRILCEKLCSLEPTSDRLAFSVVWRMSCTGEVLSEWYGRTIIRSCGKMTYDQVQGIIDDGGVMVVEGEGSGVNREEIEVEEPHRWMDVVRDGTCLSFFIYILLYYYFV